MFSLENNKGQQFSAQTKNLCLFRLFRRSKIVLSYSTNGYPDREILEDLMRRYKSQVTAFERPHRYHFGTHSKVARAVVREYLIVGQ